MGTNENERQNSVFLRAPFGINLSLIRTSHDQTNLLTAL